jgi:hypothetical protein
MSIKLFHTDATSCSVGGSNYEKAPDGSFEVEDAHAAILLDHGFTTIPPEDVEAPTRKIRQKKVEE